MQNKSKYTQAMREWLSAELTRDPSTALAISAFAKKFKVPFNRNMLARLFNESGGKAAFINKYQSKEGAIIAKALMWWEPRQGRNPYAVAAMEVNKARIASGNTATVDAAYIEELVRKAGGVKAYLLAEPSILESFAEPESMAKNAQDRIRALT